MKLYKSAAIVATCALTLVSCKTEETKEYKAFLDAYFKSEWQLTRFDTGAYWIDQL